MQKTVYRVRTLHNIRGRIAMDLLRDMQADGRRNAIVTLHGTRRQRKPSPRQPRRHANSVRVL
jgi:hypothetical protein